MERQPAAEGVVGELGVPVRLILMPGRFLGPGKLADHVAPARQPLDLDVEQGGGVAAGVADVGRLEDLWVLDLGHEGLAEQRWSGLAFRVGPIHRRARLTGVLRGEDVFVDLDEPGELLFGRDACDDEEPGLGEEGDLLRRWCDLKRGRWRWSKVGVTIPPTLVCVKSISQLAPSHVSRRVRSFRRAALDRPRTTASWRGRHRGWRGAAGGGRERIRRTR